MALLDLANISPHDQRNNICRILNYKRHEGSNFTTYIIQVNVGEYTWTVERRYSEFAEFDYKRFRDRKRSFLPPKKIIGNADVEFLIERRAELEQYLRTVVELELWLQQKRKASTLPSLLAKFLDFHQYEVHAIANDLAERLTTQGDKWLESSSKRPKYFEFTPIELNALTERLKLPQSTTSASSSRGARDIGYAIEFLHRVTNLKVRGAKGYVGTSNIVWNSLPFSLCHCKNLVALWLADCDAKAISGLASIKKALKYLVVHYTLDAISDLMAECGSTDPIVEQMQWTALEDVDLSFNQIRELDESVILLGQVCKLNLSHNNLSDIGHYLQHLTNLTELNLAFNGIETVQDWHKRFGNVKRLLLAGNSIRSLKGADKLYSLEYIDLKDNALATVPDVWPIGCLPCLYQVILVGNPVETIVEYRTRIFEAFSDRAPEVKLDDGRASEKELDTVNVRLAIRKAKEEKEAMLEKSRDEVGSKLRFLSIDNTSTEESRAGSSLDDDLSQELHFDPI